MYTMETRAQGLSEARRAGVDSLEGDGAHCDITEQVTQYYRNLGVPERRGGDPGANFSCD